jgi:GT2 family glycosyltransferase
MTLDITSDRSAATMTAPRPDVSLIIVSWNTRALLEQCLTSMFGTTDRERASSGGAAVDGMSVEVIVVDNASADGSAEMVRDRFPCVRLIANTSNRGFAPANNQAYRACTGQYVLLLNPDTRPYPEALASLKRFMDGHPDAGAAGPLLLNPDQTLQTSCYPAPTLPREVWRLFHFDALRPFGSYRMAEWDITKPRQVDIIQGACLILRRSALDRVGFLDEDYFIYSEEVDLLHRLARAGWQTWWVPSASVMHYGGQSTRQVAAAMFLRLYQAKILYFRKNYGPTVARAYKLVLLSAALSRVMLAPLAWCWPTARRQDYRSLVANYARLIRALPEF